jgi:hypothetical protein
MLTTKKTNIMSVKTNDATINRPEGNRIIDAPAVSVDLNKYIAQIKEEAAWKKNDRNAITVFKTPGLTMVLSALHKGAAMEDLEVEGVLVLQVVEGAITIESGNDSTTLGEKQLMVFHPECKQNITADEETVLLLSNMAVAQ